MKLWVTFQLNEKGEMTLEDEPELIEKVIKKHISSKYFLPLYYNKSKSYENKLFLFRGYIFLEYNEKDIRNYAVLAATPYFVGPLLVHGKIHLTANDQIKKLKNQLNKMIRPVIKVGDKVKILDGKYKNLKATVTNYYKKEKEVDLAINLKCMNILVPRISITCLRSVAAEEKIKNNLMTKILYLLKNYPKGLTRKQIIQKLEISEKEVKRVSTCLARAIQRKIIKYFQNENKKTLFIHV